MLTELRLCDFRCFAELDFHPGPGRTFIVGANAQGKTSLLEAACLLLRLQSPRTSAQGELVRFGCDAFSIDGRYAGSHLAIRHGAGGREVLLDSKPQPRTGDYLDVGRVAWFANSDLELVRGPGAVRRRYLDFLGAQSVPGYLQALRAYERALRSRNALLRDARPRCEVQAFDDPLVEAGNLLLSSRAGLCSEIAPLVRLACMEISANGDELEIRHRPGASPSFREALANSRDREDRLRQTVVGPHRDDLELALNASPAAAFASEGQQRGIALALKLAQARHLQAVQGRPPLLLLDDIFGELDATRRNLLLASLPIGSQALITTTFLDWAENTAGDMVVNLSGGKLG